MKTPFADIIASSTKARKYAPGIGDAVADRTINRRLDPQTRDELPPLPYGVKDTRPFVRETWEEVSYRVSEGNALLAPMHDQMFEFNRLNHHLRQASLLMSGRHLQHGDKNQPNRPGEVLTNCATSASTYVMFYLLLNGSGVGRSYDDSMMLVDYAKQPTVVCVLNRNHPDVVLGLVNAPTLEETQELYQGRTITHFMVPDSREGWAQALEQIEVMAFQGRTDEVLILDFSEVRPNGSPIRGMQNRPASGPGPLMDAIKNIAALRGLALPAWRLTMHADHYAAECVLVGGARRAARMSTKHWKDPGIFDFIQIKRGGVLWSSNNSVLVDEEFWKFVKSKESDWAFCDEKTFELYDHAKAVFKAVTEAAYFDKTGEPGLINVDRLSWDDAGTADYADGSFINQSRLELSEGAEELNRDLFTAWSEGGYKVITNPCGEIVLSSLGGYCTIADVVPFFAQNDDDAEEAFRVATRALIRVNTMDFLYNKEVKRTNRIGVGMTGFHEWAWARFGFGWKDLIDESVSKALWLTVARFKRAVEEEAAQYAKYLGVTTPATNTTFKPAGTTSALFGLTQGAHLPSMREYLRWVQFRHDDPLVKEYRAKGYPTRNLKNYTGTTIVGFPTTPLICTLGMGDKLTIAPEATPQEQYQFLRLIEKYWIDGVKEDGETPLGTNSGNQVSFTLKYDPKVVSFDAFQQTLVEGQSGIKCCSVMPAEDTSAYEYLPEDPVNKHEFEAIVAAIRAAQAEDASQVTLKEDIGMEHVDCASGACAISWGENDK